MLERLLSSAWLLAGVLCAGVAAAVPTIDQQCLDLTGPKLPIQSSERIAQAFVPTKSDHLAVRLYLADSNPNQPALDFTLTIWDGDPNGAWMGEATASPEDIPGSEGWVEFSFPSTVVLTPGNTYVIELDAQNARGQWAASSTPGPYELGIIYLEGDPLGDFRDLVFQTVIDMPPAQVPLLPRWGLPLLAALLLLVGVFSCARRA